jgi:hypothetical protein
MQDESRKEFRGRRPLSGTEIPWPFMGLFGLVGVFGGIKFVWREWDTAGEGAFRYVLLAVGAVLVIGGAVLLRIALRGWSDFQRRSRLQENHPQEPWLWSRRLWDPAGAVSQELNGGVFQFERFPFRLGSDVSGEMTLAGPLAGAPRLALHLRHMEEEPVGSISGGRNVMTVYCDHEYRVEVIGPGAGALTVRLPLPADPALTSEFGPYCKYWVLDVESVPPTGERTSFILPVY